MDLPLDNIDMMITTFDYVLIGFIVFGFLVWKNWL